MTIRNANRSRAATRNRNETVAIFAANLKAARLKAGLTQAQLAERTGLLQQYVSLVESGKQDITLKTAVVFARSVDRDVLMLLARRGRP
jgi:transcriptional regulator with XRE-family HTH domain